MNRKLTKAISIFMSAAIFTSCTALCSFAADKDVDYKINSTYANVDWSTYKQYKTDLHSHTTGTDGTSTKKETIEKHYDYGFDILAITDHGTTDYGWDDISTNKAVKIAMTVRRASSPLRLCRSAARPLTARIIPTTEAITPSTTRAAMPKTQCSECPSATSRTRPRSTTLMSAHGS